MPWAIRQVRVRQIVRALFKHKSVLDLLPLTDSIFYDIDWDFFKTHLQPLISEYLGILV